MADAQDAAFTLPKYKFVSLMYYLALYVLHMCITAKLMLLLQKYTYVMLP